MFLSQNKRYRGGIDLEADRHGTFQFDPLKYKMDSRRGGLR